MNDTCLVLYQRRWCKPRASERYPAVGILSSLKHLPSAAFKALKGYFAGLGLFFNRQNWSHGVVFVATIVFFASYRLVQPWLKWLYLTSGIELPTLVIDISRIVFFGGSGAFLAFLFLGLLAIPARGRHLLYESRLRHLVSPLTVGLFILGFSQGIPLLLRSGNPFWDLVFGLGGLLELSFNVCWLVMLLLQVILIGYSVVRAAKWLWGYVPVPESNGRSGSSIAGTAILIFLIPVAILLWMPLIRLIMFGPVPPVLSAPPAQLERLLVVKMLLSLDPADYRTYLLILCPLVIAAAVFLLWKRRPQAALAVAGFGSAYPVLVYYYRLRVVQYYIVWDSIRLGVAPQPYFGSALFELALVVIAFLMTLQGTARLQRSVSPNPFGLFALMIGAIIGALALIFKTPAGLGIWWGVETFGMISAALSAFLAIFVFATLPIAYDTIQLRHTSLSVASPRPSASPPPAREAPS